MLNLMYLIIHILLPVVFPGLKNTKDNYTDNGYPE